MKKILTAGSVVTGILLAAWFFGPITRETKTENRSFTREERQQLTHELIVRLNNQTPREAINRLRRLADKDPRVVRDCHPLVHALGQAAYTKYQDFGQAMRYRDEFCNAGYIHGAIEARFLEGVNEAELLTMCQGQLSLNAWECDHGLGHGLMYASGNDLPHSLDQCELLLEAGQRRSCQNGVWMENFNGDDTDHPSDWRRTSDPFYPCPDQPAHRRADCFFYAPVYFLVIHPSAYPQMLALCATLPTAEGHTCALGVGTQAAKENLDRLSVMAAACDQASASLAAACLEGGYAYLNFHTGGNRRTALSYCQSLSLTDRTYCQRIVSR